MAGYIVTGPTLANEAGNVVLSLRMALDRVQAVKLWLDDHDDASLLALGLLQADITLTRAAVTDLDKLARISHAQDTQSGANDFWFNARHLTGLN